MVGIPRADARDMFAMHTAFRREFGLMPALVRGVEPGDRARVALVADHITLLTRVLTIHLAGEDEHIWPRLRARGTSCAAFFAGVMEEQHDAIRRAVARVEEAVTAWRAGESSHARDAVAEATERLIADTSEHMALEYVRVVPLIEEYVTASEYSVLTPEVAASCPAELLPVVVGMFAYEAQPEVADMVVGRVSCEFQPLFRELADKAYGVYARELYGTSTPPRVTSRNG